MWPYACPPTGESTTGLRKLVAHALIHLGYGFELSSHTVAVEALALTACFYNFLHKYLDDPSYTQPAPYSSTSPLEILNKIARDERFDGLFDKQGSRNIATLFEKREDAVLEHWNAWEISDPKEQFEASQRAAVALLMATPRPANDKHDFFIVHLLTSSHAVRILLPLIPAKWHVPLVRQWWLFTIAVYIAQLRPPIEMGRITDYNLRGRDWELVNDRALNSKHATDAHHVKGPLSPL